MPGAHGPDQLSASTRRQLCARGTDPADMASQRTRAAHGARWRAHQVAGPRATCSLVAASASYIYWQLLRERRRHRAAVEAARERISSTSSSRRFFWLYRGGAAMQPPIRLWACSCWEQASFLAMGAWGIGGAIGAVVGGRGTHTVTIPRYRRIL